MRYYSPLLGTLYVKLDTAWMDAPQHVRPIISRAPQRFVMRTIFHSKEFYYSLPLAYLVLESTLVQRHVESVVSSTRTLEPGERRILWIDKQGVWILLPTVMRDEDFQMREGFDDTATYRAPYVKQLQTVLRTWKESFCRYESTRSGSVPYETCAGMPKSGLTRPFL